MSDTFPLVHKSWRWLAYAALALAFAFFCWRGPGRALTGGSYDFSMMYAGSAAWADGSNPYVLADATAAMAARGGRLDATAVLLYPPSALAALWPLTWVSFGVAKTLWVVVQGLAWLGLAVGLRHLAGEHLRHGLAGWLFALACLLWVPVHTGFYVGQVALPVAALMVWSVVLAEGRQGVGAGLLLGLAIALKPQLGSAFLPLLLLRGHWLALLVAVLTTGGWYALGAWTLASAAPDWVLDWRANVHAFADGGYGDVALPWARAQMVQASTLWAALGLVFAVALGYGVAAVVGGCWLFTHWRSRFEMEPLAMMAALGLVVLLAGYHRTYDAVLALVPMAYGLRLVAENKHSPTGWSLVALLAVFLTPGGTMLARWWPEATRGGPWWVQFQTVALLGGMVVVAIGAGIPAKRLALVPTRA